MALQPPAASLGTLGNYDLLEKVGEGSMGTVYRAMHWTTKEIVAIKVMPSHVARKPLLLKRFELEFRIANRVHHPNVVRVLEYSGQGPEPFLVMEFVEGASLGERLEAQGRLTEEEALRLTIQVGEGLRCAHDLGLLHRDVKPDNILVTREGNAKLADLGLGKEVDSDGELTRTGAGLGTPNFMAPEQFRNAKHADARCDVYSLAATLYQMLTAELPFGVGDPVRIMMRKLNGELKPVRQVVAEVSARTEAALLRAMDPDPQRRTPTCREFLDDLLGRRVIPASDPPPGANGSVSSSGLVRRRDMETRLGEWMAAKGNGLRQQPALGPANPAQAPAERPAPKPAAVPSWRVPVTQPPEGQGGAPPRSRGLSTERFRGRTPTDGVPRQKTPPPSDVRQSSIPTLAWFTERWKLLLLFAGTGLAALIVGLIWFLLV